MDFIAQLFPGVSPVLINAVFVALVIVVGYFAALMLRRIASTEWFKSARERYELLFKVVTDAVFQAELADASTRAAYEEKARTTGYPVKVLIVFDLVEAQVAKYGFKVDLETEVLPMIARALGSDVTRPDMTPGANKTTVLLDREPPTLDEASMKALAAAKRRGL